MTTSISTVCLERPIGRQPGEAARVFRIDISVCSRCSGPMRVTRAVTTAQDIAAELRGARPPPTAP